MCVCACVRVCVCACVRGCVGAWRMPCRAHPKRNCLSQPENERGIPRPLRGRAPTERSRPTRTATSGEYWPPAVAKVPALVLLARMVAITTQHKKGNVLHLKQLVAVCRKLFQLPWSSPRASQILSPSGIASGWRNSPSRVTMQAAFYPQRINTIQKIPAEVTG